MSAHSDRKSVTTATLKQGKQNGDKFSVLTAYDATFAALADTAGIDMLLVGDSLGMVLQGKDSTLPVSIDDMAYHTECVSRGSKNCLIMADMPFMANSSTEATLLNAGTLMQAGAHIVKLEGGRWIADDVIALSQRGIPVCAHLGLTPQSVNKLGGYRVQGKDETSAQKMVDDATHLVEAGADIVLLECVPTKVAQAITDAVDAPVIGIGAGNVTDGQILVMHDMLGLNQGHTPKFVRNFMAESDSVLDAFSAYDKAVKNASFPSEAHSFNS